MQERQDVTRGVRPGGPRRGPGMPGPLAAAVVFAALLRAVVPSAAGAEEVGRGLIEAVRAEDAESVVALLDRGADARASQPDGATALHWASYRDAVDLADLLIDAGAGVDAANDYGVTPSRSPARTARRAWRGGSWRPARTPISAARRARPP